jgi:hypothetical protein
MTMTPAQIRRTPQIVDDIHESRFRSYHVLQYTKALLANGVPADVILDQIADLEGSREDEAADKVEQVMIDLLNIAASPGMGEVAAKTLRSHAETMRAVLDILGGKKPAPDRPA